jgi:hypothetical protein
LTGPERSHFLNSFLMLDELDSNQIL